MAHNLIKPFCFASALDCKLLKCSNEVCRGNSNTNWFSGISAVFNGDNVIFMITAVTNCKHQPVSGPILLSPGGWVHRSYCGNGSCITIWSTWPDNYVQLRGCLLPGWTWFVLWSLPVDSNPSFVLEQQKLYQYSWAQWMIWSVINVFTVFSFQLEMFQIDTLNHVAYGNRTELESVALGIAMCSIALS